MDPYVIPESPILLTIVTINRNNAANLPRTIASLQEIAGARAVECLFVDGASVDASVEIARSFYSPDELISEPDTGIYNAMNKGLARAKGMWVLWLNSGDELLPGAASVILSALERTESEALVAFGAQMEYPDQPERNHVFAATEKGLSVGSLPHCGACFRRDVLERIGGYFEGFKIVSDRDLFMRLFKNGVLIKTHSEVIAKFYAGGISYSRLQALETYKLYYRHGYYSCAGYILRVLKYYLQNAKSEMRTRWRRWVMAVKHRGSK